MDDLQVQGSHQDFHFSRNIDVPWTWLGAGLRNTTVPFQLEGVCSASVVEARFLPVQREVCPQSLRGRAYSPPPRLTWAEHVHSIVGQGLPPLTGEAQGVLILGAFGKRGGQAGGAVRRAPLRPDGKPSPH